MATIKSTIRAVKAIGKGYSDLEIKVRQATCNDTWGPSGSLMQEITQYSHNSRDFIIIMEIIDKRLNDSGKNWRHVFKALTLIQYMLENGPEDVISHCKRNLAAIKTLREFQYIDESGHDQVRQKSKEVTALLTDDARLRELRENRGATRERLYGGRTSSSDNYRRSGEDDDLKRAIALSKEQAQVDERRRLERQEEADLQRAIELSEREAMQKRMEQRDQLAAGNNVGQKDDIIDFFGSLEPAPQPMTQQQDLFGGFDPFQLEQQRMMEQQQYLQQQMFLQEQQRQQMLQQQFMQEQMRQQQLLQQQQQQQQQNQFAAQFASNPHNPFAAPVPPQPKKEPVQPVDLSTNPKYFYLISAVLDPFASLSTKQNPSGPNTMGMNVGGQGMNPFASSKPLVDLDALSNSSNQQPVQKKNPFDSSNSGKYQCEAPKAPQPTLAQLQTPPMPNNTMGMQMGMNPMGMQMTGGSQFGNSQFPGSQFGGLSNQMTGTSQQSFNPFGQTVQPLGQPQPVGNNANPFQQTNPFGQQNSFF